MPTERYRAIGELRFEQGLARGADGRLTMEEAAHVALGTNVLFAAMDRIEGDGLGG